MAEIIDKIVDKTKQVGIGMILGMKNTEDATLHQSGLDGGINGGIYQNITDKRVALNLLRGEITESVKELIWRTYKIEEEAANWEYYSPFYAKKAFKADVHHAAYDDSDRLELITIQDNNDFIDTAKTMEKYMAVIDIEASTDKYMEALGKGAEENGVDIETFYRNHEWDKKRHAVMEDVGFVFKKGASMPQPVKTYIIHAEHPVTATNNITPYIKKVVVKKTDNEENLAFDLYFSKYPARGDFKQRRLLEEIKRIKDGLPSDIFDLDRLWFDTQEAYNIHNAVRFDFSKIQFLSIAEYDGHYVAKFTGKCRFKDESLSDKHYSESMAKKYANNTPRPASYVYADGAMENLREFECCRCHKKVVYNAKDIDFMEPDRDGADIDDKPNTDTMEFVDMEIYKNMHGEFVCRNCQLKELDEMLASTSAKVIKDLK